MSSARRSCDSRSPCQENTALIQRSHGRAVLATAQLNIWQHEQATAALTCSKRSFSHRAVAGRTDDATIRCHRPDQQRRGSMRGSCSQLLIRAVRQAAQRQPSAVLVHNGPTRTAGRRVWGSAEVWGSRSAERSCICLVGPPRALRFVRAYAHLAGPGCGNEETQETAQLCQACKRGCAALAWSDRRSIWQDDSIEADPRGQRWEFGEHSKHWLLVGAVVCQGGARVCSTL